MCSAELDVPAAETPAPARLEEDEALPDEAALGPWEQTSTHWDAWEEAPLEPEEASPEVSRSAPAPWERIHEIGFWPAFSQTWVGASLHPRRFFQELGAHPSIWPAFLFALLILGLTSIVSTLWSELLVRSLGGEAAFFFPEWGAAPASGFGILWIVPSLISSALGIFVFAVITHLGCFLAGAARRGFETTFRTVAYALAPGLLGVLPGVGFIGIVWVYVVLIIGLRYTQETTTGRAAFAVLLPFIALGALVIAVAALAAIFFLV